MENIYSQLELLYLRLPVSVSGDQLTPVVTEMLPLSFLTSCITHLTHSVSSDVSLPYTSLIKIAQKNILTCLIL